jgi:hypothetical protein
MEDNTFGWSAPSSTFPVLVNLVTLPNYCQPAIAGLLISVGGLTESVVRSSSDALLNLTSQLCSEENDRSRIESLSLIAAALLYSLTEYRGHVRVVVPALKTCELLLDNGMFDELPEKEFPKSLDTRIWKEIQKSASIPKLLAAIPVFIALLTFPGLRQSVYSHIFVLLQHSFPKVRRVCAETYYKRLIAGEDLRVPEFQSSSQNEANLDSILENITTILSETSWDGNIVKVRESCQKLIHLLGVDPSTIAQAISESSATSSSKPSKPVAPAAPDDAYASLVNSAGY